MSLWAAVGLPYDGCIAMPFPTTPPSGGFGALGGAVFAISILLSMRKQPPGPVGMLVDAGATGPETALKPRTAGIRRPDELKTPIRKGIVQELEDGRCWVDLVYLKRRRLKLAIYSFLGVMVAIDLLWLFLRWVKAI